MRGASRCVWCTKVSRLIEVELFAEQIQRPAQNGRALLCAANHESNRPWHEKKESTGSNLCSPFAFRRATEGSRVRRKVRGVKRGQETILGVLSPFVSARGDPGNPPPPGGGISSAVRYGLCRLQRRTAVSAETPPSADGKKRSTVKAQPHRSASTLAISPRVILPSGRSVPSV